MLDNPEDEEQVEAAQYRITVDQGATIVTIYAGMKPTGGYAVKIGKVTRNGDTCRVSYGVRGPSPDSMVTQALTYPSASVRVEAKCPNVEVNPPVPRGPLNSPRDGQTK